MNNIKVMTCFGTRPEAVKMCPLVKELEKEKRIDSNVCVTAQHRQMLDQVLDVFGIIPKYDLNIMKKSQSLADITKRVLDGMDKILKKEKPDLILVHGDTQTSFVVALLAYYNQILTGHVEAGLRTYNKFSPFPEEMNRRLTGALADLHFCPTFDNKNNLLKEGVLEKNIYVTGNTVIDALDTTVNSDYVFENKILKEIDYINNKVITLTAHRRENLGKPLEEIFNAVLEIVENNNDVLIVYPVHLNPKVKETAKQMLGNNSRIKLIEPIGVLDMHNLLKKSFMVMTDSGGLQEEAPSLKKPVVVLRNETERMEAVNAGTVKLAGVSKTKILDLVNDILDNKKTYIEMVQSKNPYGDGCASKRIVKAILYQFGRIDIRPKDLR